MSKHPKLRTGFENWEDPHAVDLADFLDDLRRDGRPSRGLRALLASLVGRPRGGGK